MGYLVKVMGLLMVLNAVADPQVPAPSQGIEQKKNLQYYVGIALTQAFEDLRLGATEKKFFENEVLPDGLLFVTGYGTTLEGTDVQVDRKKLQNYLRLTPSLFASGGSGSDIPTICVTARAAAQCAPCMAVETKLQEAAISRFMSRGFNAKAGLSVAEEAMLSGERALDYLTAKSAEARCDGVAYFEISPESADDADAGTVKIKTLGFLQLKNKGGQKLRGRSASTIVVNADEAKTTNNIMAKQLSDLFSVVASQTSAVPTQAKAEDEKYLKLEGVNGFATYARFKQLMATSLPDVKLEERFMRPGVIEFAVEPTQGLAQLASQLRSLSGVDVVRVSSNDLTVVLR